MRFEEAVENFITGYFSTCKRSGKTQAAYGIDLAQLQRRVGASAVLQSIQPDSLEHWAMEMQSEGYASVSIRRKFASARVFFSYWVRRGALDASPLWRIRLDLSTGRVLPRSLTPADAKRLIEQAWRGVILPDRPIVVPRDPRFLEIRNMAATEVLFATGMRVGELVALGLEDWNEDDKSFLVKGKGGRQRMAILPDDRSLAGIQMYLSHRRAMDLDHGGFFINANGKRISTQGIAKIITRIAEQASLEVRVTPHMLRHTVATLLLRYGADIRVVQEILGHSSITTTQRYTHVSSSHLVSTLTTCHPNRHLDIRPRLRVAPA